MSRIAIPVKELCSIIVDCKNRTPPFVDDEESPYFVVRTSNIRSGKLIRSTLKRTTEEGYREWTARAVPSKGDVIITREAPLGEVCLVPDDIKVCLGQRMMLYRPDPKKLDSLYLLYALSSPWVQRNLKRKKGGSTVGHARVDTIKSIRIPYRDLPEQIHIGKLISTWDEALQLIDDEITSYELLLKGLREQIVKEGDLEVKIQDLCRVNPEMIGNSPDVPAAFRYLDLSSVDTYSFELPAERCDLKSAPSRARRIARNGDILVSTVRPNLLGYCVLEGLDEPIVVSTGFAVLRSQTSWEAQLAFNALFSNSAQKQMSTKLVGSNYPAINSSEVGKLTFNIFRDQILNRNYAGIFADLVDAITKLRRLRALYCQQKVYLLQTLFPGVDE